MPDSAAQQFLRDLDKKLWGAADRLRASLDAAVYKHAVLALIFLKYVSDSLRPGRELRRLKAKGTGLAQSGLGLRVFTLQQVSTLAGLTIGLVIFRQRRKVEARR